MSVEAKNTFPLPALTLEQRIEALHAIVARPLLYETANFVLDEANFYGLQARKALTLCSSREDNILLFGERRTGKTTTLLQARKMLNDGQPAEKAFYCDCTGCGFSSKDKDSAANLHLFIDVLAKAMKVNGYQGIESKLSQAGGRTVLLIDEMDHLLANPFAAKDVFNVINGWYLEKKIYYVLAAPMHYLDASIVMSGTYGPNIASIVKPKNRVCLSGCTLDELSALLCSYPIRDSSPYDLVPGFTRAVFDMTGGRVFLVKSVIDGLIIRRLESSKSDSLYREVAEELEDPARVVELVLINENIHIDTATIYDLWFHHSYDFVPVIVDYLLHQNEGGKPRSVPIEELYRAAKSSLEEEGLNKAVFRRTVDYYCRIGMFQRAGSCGFPQLMLDQSGLFQLYLKYRIGEDGRFNPFLDQNRERPVTMPVARF